MMHTVVSATVKARNKPNRRRSDKNPKFGTTTEPRRPAANTLDRTIPSGHLGAVGTALSKDNIPWSAWPTTDALPSVLRQAGALWATFFVCAALGAAMVRLSNDVTPLWLSSALLLAVLLRSPRSSWLVYAFGCLLLATAANLIVEQPWSAAGFAFVDILAVLVAAALIRRGSAVSIAPKDKDEIARFIGQIVLLAPIVGASVGIRIVYQTAEISGGYTWWAWWAATALTMLIIMPLILYWTPESLDKLKSPRKLWELAAFGAAIAAIVGFGSAVQFPFALAFAFPVLLGVAIRLGPLANSLAALLLTALTVGLTVLGTGLLGNFSTTIAEQIVIIQVYLVTTTVTTFIIAALIDVQEKTNREVMQLNRELTDATESLPAAFIEYGPDDRVVRFNSRVFDFFPALWDKLVPGVHVEVLTRARLEQSMPDLPKEKIDDLVTARLKAFRAPRRVFEERLPDGRWTEVHERRTEDGGTICIRVDISDRKKSERTLHHTANAISSLTGRVFFHDLLVGLTKTLAVDNAFLAERVAGPGARLKILAAAVDNDRWRDREHDIAGTAAAQALDHGPAVLVGNLKKQFPADPYFAAGDFKNYLGIPLRNNGGKPYGVLSVVSGRSIEKPNAARALLRIFAARATSEMERMRTEDSLGESEERFRDFAEAASDWFWEMDANLRFTDFVGSRRENSGRVGGDNVGLTRWEVAGVNPDNDPMWRDHRAILEAHKPFRDFEYSQTTKAGRFSWVRVSGMPIFDRARNFTGYRGTASDITAVKLTEQALRASEQRFKRLVETTNVVAWEWDPATRRLTYVSPQIVKLLGYPQEDWYGRDFWRNHIHADDRPRTLRLGMEAADGAKDHNLEYRLIATDGRSVWVRDIVAVTSENDGAKSLRGFMIDVTERKNAEQKFRESEDRFLHMIEDSIQGILIHRDGVPLFANEAWAEIHGYTLEELGTIKSPASFVCPVDRMRVATFSKNGQAGSPTPIRYEYQALKKDGSVIWLENVESQVTWKGEPAVQSAVIDITDRKHAELRERKLQVERTHANRLSVMGEMATGLAHELNQPLSAIANYAQGCALRLRARKMEREKVIALVEKIANQALRAGEIIRRMRDFSRKEELSEKTLLDVNSLVREAIELLESELRGNRLTIEMNLLDELPWTMADGVQIQQVVLNLARNGWEAMRDTKSAPGVLRIGTSLDGNATIKVTVQDCGPGIMAAMKENLFTPFFTTKPRGLGMGLAIARSIVEDHDGHIDLLPDPKGGTIAHFTLPIVGDTK